ncbi:MAG: ribonuclease PH [Chloroflexi bacterium]|nr:ribonuclease PH [Chloroflexota bacterium]
MVSRRHGRGPEELRALTIETGVLRHAEGSALISMGDTRVLCAASVEHGVPRWLRGTGHGGGPAAVGNQPPPAPPRRPPGARGRGPGGRSQEIQRLIGRSLRAALDLDRLGEQTITVDCDVIQADGGTRTAAITGGWVALALAIDWLSRGGALAGSPLTTQVAAISVGLSDGTALLDLDYDEDSSADTDFNVVQLGTGKLVEVQGTAEHAPFSRGDLDRVVAVATAGIAQLFEAQREAVAADRAAQR